MMELLGLIAGAYGVAPVIAAFRERVPGWARRGAYARLGLSEWTQHIHAFVVGFMIALFGASFVAVAAASWLD